MSSRQAGFCALGYAFVILALPSAASAQAINTGSTVNASTLGTGTPAFQGGTLIVDKSGTYANNFTLLLEATNTIDAHGNTGIFSGIFADSEAGTFGGLTISDAVGGGEVVLSGVNTFTGTTTISSGAVFALSGSGSITSSQGVQDNGTFDISGAGAAISIISLGGTGTVVLGAQQLRLTSAVDTFSGTISGTGGFTVAGGVETLDGANTYTGGTTIGGTGTLVLGNADTNGSIVGNIANSGTLEFNRTDAITFGQVISGSGAVTMGGGTVTITSPQTYTGSTTISTGTLALSGSGSIAASQILTADGTFDISATTGASIKSLSGSGTVALGAQTLTITQANAVFSGAITGTGGLILSSGTQYLTGTNTYTGGTTITAGTLQLGNGGAFGSIMGNIVDGGTLALDGSGATTFSQTVSGTGGLTQLGGTLTITTSQTYTGPTTISSGTLALSGSASIAASQGVIANGTFDISGASGGVSIVSLSGAGAVQLGANILTLANASGTFNGIILGTGGITIAGGTQALSGQGLYTGITTITSGTLSVLGENALASSSGIVDNALLDISGAKNSSNSAASVSITTLRGAGNVTLGANTLVLTQAADSFSGSLSGNGGLTIVTGSETLAGQNNFNGVAAISSGASLLLSGGGNLAGTSVSVGGIFDISAATGGTVAAGSLAGAGMVKLGGNTLNLGAASTDFSGIISGTGGIIVNGGTQILSGSNTYTGSTAINGGTLQLGDGGTTGAIIGNVADRGVLAFDYSAPTTFAGTISGQGAVNQAGAGTTILTAANSYAGGTTISTGTLQLGNGGTTGAITGNVTDNGTLAFDRADATSFGGVISGTGGVAQIGTGNLTLTGVNSYTGATTIASGATLTIGAAGSIASSSTVAVNGLLDVSAATTPQIASLAGAGTVVIGANTLAVTNGAGAFSGTISGTGGLAVSGGTQTLSGTNTYTGATAVSAGTLAVNGSIRQSSGVTIGSGGVLAGTGAAPSVTVTSGGTLAPGMSGAGTLTVNSNVVFAGGSTFLINNSSTSAPNLVVTGTAGLAGTLAVASTDGTYLLGQKITVLTASGGVNGTFTAAAVPAAAATAASGAQYTSAISYDSNDVYLQIQLAKLSPALSSGASVNQQHAIGGIDTAIAAGNTLPQSFENLGILPSASLTSDAQQLAGELGSDITLADNAMFNPFLDAIFDQMTDDRQPGSTIKHARTNSGIRIWADGFIGGGVTSGGPLTYGTSKFSSHARGFVLGADWQAGSHMTLGGALSLGSSDFHVASSLGSGHATALEAGLYGNIQFSPHIYGSFAGAFAQNTDTTDRVLTISGTDDVTGHFKSNMFGARYESGITLKWLTPYFAVEDKFVQTPAYNETASSGSGAFALQYADHTSNMPDVELGLRQRKDVAMGRNWVLTLSDRLGWDHTMWAYPSALAAYVALPSSQFTTYGARPVRDAALLSLGAALQNKAGLDFDLHFDSTVSKKSQAYNGIAGLRFAW